MKEYLINVGEFNIIVLPHERKYFMLPGGEESANVQNKFVQGEAIAFENLTPLWFQYEQNELWHDFEGKSYRLGADVAEADLIDMFVLKKFNFGSLVAVRDGEGTKVKVFKRDMLKTRTYAT